MDDIAILIFYQQVEFYLIAPVFDFLPFYTKHTYIPGSGGTIESCLQKDHQVCLTYLQAKVDCRFRNAALKVISPKGIKYEPFFSLVFRLLNELQ